MRWQFCCYFQLSTLTALQRIHNDWMKVNSCLQYSCSPQHLSFKSFISQNTPCGFAKPGTYLFNQRVSTADFLCSYVTERPNLDMNWSDEGLANQESNSNCPTDFQSWLKCTTISFSIYTVLKTNNSCSLANVGLNKGTPVRHIRQCRQAYSSIPIFYLNTRWW